MKLQADDPRRWFEVELLDFDASLMCRFCRRECKRSGNQLRCSDIRCRGVGVIEKLPSPVDPTKTYESMTWSKAS